MPPDLGCKFSETRTQPVLEPAATPSPSVGDGLYLRCRYIIERFAAILLLIAAVPVVLIAAVLVKLSGPGRVFYTQRRVGQGGKIFSIFKIRTMVEESEVGTGPVWSGPDDPRVTPLGRFLRSTHLDELPQLINVIRGEMSLIGPRPERPELIPEIEEQLPWYSKRLRMRPGMTGLAQVHLLSDLNIESVRRKLGYDLYYISHAGPWLDMRILIGTLLYLIAVTFHSLGKLLTQPDRYRIERQLGAETMPPSAESDEWPLVLESGFEAETR
jgi:lipopolysaccharide/colanic/teichoic acid biosynthesis glycosyltransferase